MIRTLLVLLIVSAVYAQKDCDGSAPNSHEVYTAAPTFIKSTTNGKLYQTYSNDPALNVLHLYGTPYEMGYAHGELLRENITWLYPRFYDWVDAQINQYVQKYKLPPSWIKVFEKDGVPALLDLNYEVVRPYVDEWFVEEMQGMADALGLTFMDVARIHMFPEVIKASCTMVGAWGSATPTESLVQLRALDWNTNGPFNAVPTLMVYHPTGLGHDFSVLGWSGFIGAMTGYSSAPVGVCEKVWLHFKGKSSRIGSPWMFVLRNILQFDEDTTQAIARLEKAHRTCSIFVGVGNPKTKFQVVEYAHPNITVWNTTTFPSYTNHPKIPEVIYVDKHTQPSTHTCLPSVLQMGYNRTKKIDAAFFYQDVVGYHQTGDMHAAVYDFEKDTIFVSTASINTGNLTHNTALPAYSRSFTKLDMKELFAVPHP